MSWTRDGLLAAIAEFERVALQAAFSDMRARKSAMRFAVQQCSDVNVKYILGRSIDSISRDTAQVRRAIGLAREHVTTLIENGCL